jgi:uncharacterized alkaline shock family protein YloU
LQPASPRVRLARAALAAALALPDVAGTDSGPGASHVTRDGGNTLEGVTAAATPDGRFDVSLTIVASYGPSLDGAAERVREAVAAAAAREGLTARLGHVAVHVADVADPFAVVAAP